MRATYYISFDNWSNQTQIYPSNEPKVKANPEPGEIFLRAKVDNFVIGATKNSASYNTILGYFNTPDMSSMIYFKIVSDVTYNFKAPISDGRINTETKVYYIAPEPDDEYRPILDIYKRKIKFSSITGNTFYPPKLNTSTFTNVGFTSFAETNKNVSISGDTGDYITQEIVVGVVQQQMQVRVCIANLTTNETIRMRLENSLGTALSADTNITADGSFIITYSNVVVASDCFLIIEAIANSTVATFDYSVYNLDQSLGLGSQTLESFIAGIFSSLGVTATPISTYLWNDAVSADSPAAISSYMTSNPANDYVTETVAVMNGISVMRTDQLLGGTTADIKLSLEDVMIILRTKIRAWWYLDAEGQFRIEHEKYFRSYTSQLNLTAGVYPAMKPEVDHKIYTYNKGDIYSQLNYKEQNESGVFIADPIEYDINLTTKNTKDINLDITCDIDHAYNNPSASTDSGICLMTGTIASSIFTVDIIKTGTAIWTVNYYMSWMYLFANYWSYFGEADEADINNGTTLTMDSVKEFMEQEDVKFYYASALDWKKPLTLSKGTAWIRSWEHSPETGFYNINVAYNPYL